MPQTVPSPLNQDHCDLCKKVQQSVPQALELARMCADCGLDMSQEIRQLEDQKRRADTILQVFFPHQS
jgi:Zn ribbon nucleic-acid-binding protein